MAEITDAERMMRMETRLDSMEQLMIRMDTKLDAWNENFMPRRESEARFGAVQSDITALEQKMQNNWNNVPYWIAAGCAVTAVVISVWPRVHP